ncbi:hypothetical protein FRC07_001360 [Ceratobasidium sp. 392]|nr:hypothetical protein FRC07_001360 [Ceratobasidium sp. 392]
MSDHRINPSSSSPTYLIMKYRDRSVAIKRDPDYQISESVWPDIISEVKSVEITLDGDDIAPPTTTGAGNGSTSQTAKDRVEVAPADNTIRAIAVNEQAPWFSSRPHPLSSRLTPQQSFSNLSKDSMIHTRKTCSVTLRTPSLKLVKFKGLHSSTTIRDVKFLIETRYGVPAALQKLCLFNILPRYLGDSNTLTQCHVASSKIVDVLVQARKSMIYLLPGGSQSSRGLSYSNVEVQVSLNRSWELANLRPATEGELGDYFQSASWVVDVSGDGILLERGSKAELTYLFWDGMTSPVQTSPSLAPSRSLNHLANTPLSRDWLRLAPLLDPRNSVAVPRVDVETYVSDVFYEFGFVDYSPRLT